MRAVLLLLMGQFALTCSAGLLQSTIIYQSSVSVDQNGPLDLKAQIFYETTRKHAPIVVVMHGYSPVTSFPDVQSNCQRLRDAGFFVIAVAMRGRDGSDGVRDSGGVEIFDIYDAVEKMKVARAEYVDPDNVSITGYSGGGGNAMSALTKFPDYFRTGSSFFGMSDYGYDAANGWYFLGASSSHQAQMRVDIGDPATGNSLVLDRYMARAANLAAQNNPYSEIHLFVNSDEAVCPAINSTGYRQNAVAAESFAGEFDNITVHIGQSNLYQDFDGDLVNDVDEQQYWPHGFPTANQQNAAEKWYRDRLVSGQIPAPVLNREDTLFVGGFVKTKPFMLWLGDGQNAAATLEYELSAVCKTFEMEIVSSNKGVTGRLTVDTSDMAGQAVSVVLNDVPIGQFTASGSYQYNALADGDTLVLLAGNVQRPADINGDSEVDMKDFCRMAEQWQAGGLALESDLDGDGLVCVDDFLTFLDKWYSGKPQVIYCSTLDTDPNWQRQGQWQFGVPQGQGGMLHGNADPVSGKTGCSVFGVNLDGDYDLRISGPHWLTLGPIDCRGFENISLEFARWLNTDEAYYMDCRIEVSTNNVDWAVLWQHEAMEPITDCSWNTVDYGLGMAEDQETVYIRWGYGVRNVRVWPYSGWNIDDVVITGKRQ